MDHTDTPSPPLPEPSDGSGRESFPIHDALLDRYLAGDVSPSERGAVERLLRTNTAMAAFVEGVRAAQRAEEASAPAEIARGRTLLADRLGFAPQYLTLDTSTSTTSEDRASIASPRGRRSAANRMPTWIRTSVAIAAGATALAVAIIAVQHRAGNIAESSTTGRTYATGTGQRATIVLDDGTRVRLAPKSTLHVPVGFGRETRAVSLVGEGYFEVSHVTGTPFLVRTGQVTTRVLGTTFDVQRYEGDRAASVTVVDGKVAVMGARTTRALATLTAGMTGIVTDSSDATVTLGDASHVVTWVDGQLVFHKAPTSVVLAALTRWYGYQFRVTDSTLADERLTLWLSTESSAAALKTLKQVLNADLTVDHHADHDVVTLTPRRGAHAIPRPSTGELAPPSPEVGR